ncbi:MAG: hypothetical protein LN415_09365 [Candidatus Thermoplasmatota archaeon]|nr:hypothetical protein [Candidatus Thermoplasmatota archaeon]
MAKRRMTEDDVSKSAERHIRREFHTEGTAILHPEATQKNMKRPDMIVVIDYQTERRQWVVHSVESKVDRRYLVVRDKRCVCSGVKQAREYKGNFRWLAISQETADDLPDDEWRKLKRDCRNTVHDVGLIVCLRTKAEVWIKPGYHPGDFIHDYKEADEYVRGLLDG